jgi:MFS family permease
MYTIDWASLWSRVPASTVPSASTSREARPGPFGASMLSWRARRTVYGLGVTSLLTDVSSEMVSSILPMYLLVFLGMSPLAFGTIDGLYQGFASLARMGSGFVADRWRRHKAVAVSGYALSALCKLGLLASGNLPGLVGLTIALDRTGKGIRTAPRDALISLSSSRGELATAFGVHRALDAMGAMLGPLVAFLLLAYLPGAFDAVFVVSFCVAMIGVAVILFFVHTGNRETAVPTPITVAAVSRLPMVAGFRQLLIAGAALSLATVSDSFVFLTLQRQIGFSATYFPLLYVGVAGGHSLLAVPAGRAADRWGRWRTFLAGHVVLLLLYALLVMPQSGWLQVILAVVLFGSYYAATDGVLAAMAAKTLPPPLCASGLAMLASATNVSRLFASILFGAVWQWAGLTNAMFLFGGSLLLAIVMAGAAFRSASH